MSNARKGRRNEWKAREWIEQLGYVVTRSAGSKGAWDLIGIGKHNIVLAQCKTNEWPSPAERAELELFEAPLGSRKLLMRFDDRKPARVLELMHKSWVEIT